MDSIFAICYLCDGIAPVDKIEVSRTGDQIAHFRCCHEDQWTYISPLESGYVEGDAYADQGQATL